MRKIYRYFETSSEQALKVLKGLSLITLLPVEQNDFIFFFNFLIFFFFFFCCCAANFFLFIRDNWKKESQKLGSAHRAMRQKWIHICAQICETNLSFFLALESWPF